MNSTASRNTEEGGAFIIPVFGGQGSPSLFSQRSATVAAQDAATPAGSLLLFYCHRAFLGEISSLNAEESTILGLGTKDFSSPESLLQIPPKFQNNPILHGTTLCLFQLLRYLAHQEASFPSFEEAFENVLETAGFCFGVLPATVVSTSQTVFEFISRGIEAFRLAFWIGLRCTAFAKQLVATDDHTHNSWSLALVGWGKQDATEKLKEFHTQNPESKLHLAAVSSSNCVTISGPGATLARFKDTYVGSSCTARFANISVLFHGGPVLGDAVQQLLLDSSRRSIIFPKFIHLNRPIRSTIDGNALEASYTGSSTLLEQVLEMIIIYPVDWETALASLKSSATDASESGNRPVNLLSFGPSSCASLCGPNSSYSTTPNLRPYDVSVVPNSLVLQEEALADAFDIAIVGMGVKFPKGNNPDELWETLTKGLNTVSEIPDTRFDVSQYYDPDNIKKGRRMGTKFGNFLDSPWEFDNLFFNISPREAQSMDPQQRVLLQTAFAAMENAGYVEDSTESFQRNSFGCYVGVATGDYVDSLRDNIDVYYSTGTLRAFLSGRISYAFKLSGPSIVVDTACSSSLIAIYQAVRALQAGDCRAALAGGVNVICGPDMYLGLDRAHFLSPTGNCKTFDASADGYCRAEGCGMFVLKRLRDAIADNDQIHGVIKGIEANQSGMASSITHPHSQTQQHLFRQLLKNTRIDPATVGVIEAHGTGTQAGDPAEIESLRQVFGVSRAADNPVYITSVKGNIGHCEAAAGAAGLAKLLLILRHKMIPFQSSLKNLNPRISLLENDSVIIPRETTEWKSSKAFPRRALLNNFGAAGSNAGMLIEEYQQRRGQYSVKSGYLFAFSAKNEIALEKLQRSYLEFLGSSGNDISLSSLCYTATARRQIFDKRIAVSATSHDDLLTKLYSASFKATAPMGTRPVVFAFSGQGSQYIGMGRELLSTCPLFKETVLRCHNELLGLGYAGILPVLSGKQEDGIEFDPKQKIEIFQCAVFVLEYALAALWMSWGVIPTSVIGHSLGEYAALAISGVLKLSDALQLVAARARLMAENCTLDTTGMLAVNLNSVKIEQIFAADKEAYGGLVLACLNSPNDCVVAGPVKQLDALKAYLKDNSICRSVKVDVPFGYHSVAMNPIIESLTEIAAKIEYSEPKIPIASNVFGRILTRGDLTPDYFAKHASYTVRFYEGLLALEVGPQATPIYFEIGPHPITLPMIKSTLPGSATTCLPSLHKQKDPWASLSSSLAELYAGGFPVNWRKVYEGDDVCVVDLPQYPLSNTEFRVPHKEPQVQAQSADATIPERNRYLLLTGMVSKSSGSPAFTTKVSTLSVLITGHIVGGSALCPASVYHELALEAAQLTFETDGREQLYILADIDYCHPMVYDQDSPDRTVEVVLQATKDATQIPIPFEIASYTSQSDRTLHCTGTVKLQQSDIVRNKFARQAASVNRQAIVIGAENSGLEKVNTRLMYDIIFSRVVTYSKGYQSVQSMNISSTGTEGYGSFRLPEELKQGRYVAQPVFMDTLLHAAGFIANSGADPSEACICSKVESVKVLYGEVNWDDTFTVYCSTLPWLNNTVLAVAYAIDSQGKVVAAIKGMHFKRLRLASFKAHLAALVGKPVEKPERSQRLRSAISPSSPSRTTISTSRSASPPRAAQVSEVVARVIAETCGVSPDAIQPSRRLEELGVDSLMTIEICEILKSRFQGLNISTDVLAACTTAQDFEEVISSNQPNTPTESTLSTPPLIENLDSFGSFSGSSRPKALDIQHLLATTAEVSEPLTEQLAGDPLSLIPAPGPDIEGLRKAMKMATLPVTLQESSSQKYPLFMIHDGSGLCNKYSNITTLDRNVYGFFNPRFFTGEAWAGGLPEMAAYYASLIVQTFAEPYIVAGWSYGGVVAFEAARQLQRLGKRVAGILLIDSPCPVNHEPLPAEVIAAASRSNFQSDTARQLEALVSAQFKSNTANLIAYSPTPYSDEMPDIVLLRSSEGFSVNGLAYTHKWLQDRSNPADASAGWEKLVGREIRVMDIPGNHFEPFEKPNVRVVSEWIRKACASFDQTDAGRSR